MENKPFEKKAPSSDPDKKDQNPQKSNEKEKTPNDPKKSN